MSSAPIIMAPRSGSAESKGALIMAHRAANRLGARIIVSHVSPAPVSPDVLKGEMGLSKEDLAGCELEWLEGQDVAQALLRRAEELQPRAIILGVAGGEEVSPITSAIISRSSWAVLVLRREVEPLASEEDHWAHRILVPLDAAPASAEAVTRAARIATREGAQLDLLHITGPGAKQPEEPGSLPVGYFVDRPHYDLKMWSIEFLNRFFHGMVPDTAGLTPELHLAVGEVADEIIAFAKENRTDLIVMAWQGVLEEGRAGVVRELLARAPCQLLFLVISGGQPA